MVAGLGLGLLLALMRGSPVAAVRTVAWGYIWIFRAIPTLVQLLFVWDALPQLIPAFRGEWFSPFFAGAIALSINEAAYAAEIFRGGLLSIDDGQRLAARALGMSPVKVFSKVIAPQLIRVTIPPLSNDFITMLKITSLASVISLQELLARTQTVVASRAPSEGYLLEAIDLHRRYGHNEVLRGVSFGVHRGDVKAVLGPSGSGKSTMLRCLALLEPVDRGEVRLEGKRIGVRESGG